MARKRGLGKRYSQADKRKILAAARKDGLTGAQVRKRFGVSTLTFYRWRGPVRRRRKSVVTGTGIGNGLIREQIQSQVRRVLPEIIRREVKEYLDRVLA